MVKQYFALKCDLCGSEMEKAAAKLYLSPVVNGRLSHPMSAYTHHGDICESCSKKLKKRLRMRIKREKKETE